MSNNVFVWVMCIMFSSEWLVASKQPKKPKAATALPVKGKQSAKKSQKQHDSEDELLDETIAEKKRLEEQTKQQRVQAEQEKQRALKVQKEQQEEQKKLQQQKQLFMQAVQKKDFTVLQQLYDQKFDFNTPLIVHEDIVVSCLCYAMDYDWDIKVVNLLIDYGAKINFGTFRIHENLVGSLLFELMMNTKSIDQQLPLFKFLLDKGASPDNGLMIYTGSESIMLDTTNPLCDLVTPLLFAAIDIQQLACIEMLLKAGANVNISFFDPQTGLEMSLLYQEICYKGSAEEKNKIIELLLAYGADINKGKVQGLYKMSPLYAAIEQMKSSVIDMLLNSQVNPKLDINFGYQYEQYYVTPLLLAINVLNFVEQHSDGMLVFYMQSIIKALIQAGADVNKGSYLGAHEVTPLQSALTLKDYEEICDLLLEAGADINIPNSITGLTIPFERVTTYMDLKSTYPDNKDFLCELRHKLYYVLNFPSYVDVFHEVQGYNILDSALWYGFGEQEKDVIKILLHKGLNPTVKNKDGKNTYDKLIELGRFDLIKQLNAILKGMGSDFEAMQYVKPLIAPEQLTDLVQDEPVSPVVSASISPMSSPTKTELKKQKKAQKLEKLALASMQESKQMVAPKAVKKAVATPVQIASHVPKITVESIKQSKGVDVQDRQQALNVVEQALHVTPIDQALIAKYVTLRSNAMGIKNIDWIHILLPVVDMVYSLKLKKYNPSFSGSHTQKAIDSLVQAGCVACVQEDVWDNGCVMCTLKNLFTGDFFIKTIFPKSWTDEQIMKAVTIADVKNSVKDPKTGNIEISLAFQDSQTAKTILIKAIAAKDFVLDILKIITVYPVKSLDDQEQSLQSFASQKVPAVA